MRWTAAILIVASVACNVPPRAPAEPQHGIAVALLVDTSGSMGEYPNGMQEAKSEVARHAIEEVFRVTDAFVEDHKTPVYVSLWSFSSDVVQVQELQPYDPEQLASQLDHLPYPNGRTAIGKAIQKAGADLYSSGYERQYLLVLTDGENTKGKSPEDGVEWLRSFNEDAGIYFVAFDTDANSFEFLRELGNADVLEASDADTLQTALQTVYEKRILLEAVEDVSPIPLRDETE